jgi:hypothetical protein
MLPCLGLFWPAGSSGGPLFSVWWALELVRMTRGAMKSIALVATALLVVLGHRGDAASLLPKHMASTVDNSAGRTQTKKINVARQRATTSSLVLQCHIDPDCSEKQQTCQLCRLGYGGPPMICRRVTKCKEHCVGLRTAPGLTEALSAVVARWGPSRSVTDGWAMGSDPRPRERFERCHDF